MSKPTVNIIILHSSSFEHLEALLGAIAKQSYKQVKAFVHFSIKEQVDELQILLDQQPFATHRVFSSPKKKHAGKIVTHPQYLFLNRVLDFIKEDLVITMDAEQQFQDRYAISRIIKSLEPGTARYLSPQPQSVPDSKPYNLCLYAQDVKTIRFDAQAKATHRFLDGLKSNKINIEIVSEPYIV
jgi:hypothetical protein